MNNELYHEVVLGFNAWYLVAPAMMLTMGFFGLLSNKIDMDSLDIIEIDNRKSLKIFSLFLSVILHFEVAIESGRGIVQVMENHADNPAYVALVILILLPISVPFVQCVLYKTAMAGKLLSLGYLVHARGIILDEREERENRKPVMIDLEKTPDNIVNFCDFRPEIDIIK